MANTKKTAAAPEPEPQDDSEATPATGAFESHIKDGPTQDDLNPAYAPPKDEGADDSSDQSETKDK